MNQLAKVVISDFKLIFRDSSLRIFLLLPVLVFLVVELVLPRLISQYEIVNEYAPYVLMAATIQVPQMFGLIYGLVFIDEKDTQVAKVYGVLPISKLGFALARLLIPALVSASIAFLLLLTQPFYELSLLANVLLCVLIGILTPIYPLGLSILSKNKLEGMTWIKGFSIILVLPLVAYFIPSAFSPIFAVFPTHWIFQGLYKAIYDEPFFGTMVIGGSYSTLLLVLAVRRFSKTHFV